MSEIPLNKFEKRDLILRLLKEGKTYREKCHIAHVAPRDIKPIAKELLRFSYFYSSYIWLKLSLLLLFLQECLHINHLSPVKLQCSQTQISELGYFLDMLCKVSSTPSNFLDNLYFFLNNLYTEF